MLAHKDGGQVSNNDKTKSAPFTMTSIINYYCSHRSNLWLKFNIEQYSKLSTKNSILVFFNKNLYFVEPFSSFSNCFNKMTDQKSRSKLKERKYKKNESADDCLEEDGGGAGHLGRCSGVEVLWLHLFLAQKLMSFGGRATIVPP